MWYVYMLQLADGNLYTGITNNVARRLREHRAGKGSKYVRAHLPCELVYLEEAIDRSEASQREYGIKKLARFEKFALCNGKGNLVLSVGRWKRLGGIAVMT